MLYKAKELTLLHSLQHGGAAFEENKELVIVSSEPNLGYKNQNKAHLTYGSEKREIYKDDNRKYEGLLITSSIAKRMKIVSLLCILGFVCMNVLSIHVSYPVSIVSDKGPLPAQYYRMNIAENKAVNTEESIEKFEVYYPNVVKPSYGDPVLHIDLFNYTFGNSYGSPFVTNFSAPEVKFNKVVLTLDTQVDGRQYDRLAHLFLGGVEIWRTSTIEPSGKPSVSHFIKDASDYAVLFQKDTTLVFELNNIVNDVYTGLFQIRMTADFYYDETVNSDADSNTIESLVSPNTLPEKILYLGEYLLTPPVLVPDTPFQVTFPDLNKNTTKVQLSIFTSGNAQEEFWYTNILDEYVKYYDGMYGHGPIRHVEVWIGGKLVAAVAPDPVIFTGGMSPALWSPMVSNDAFDLKPIDIDITALLPDLQSNPTLEIVIDNGVDHKPVGSNWITSANIHVWENEDIESSGGSVSVIQGPRYCTQSLYNSSSLHQDIQCTDNVEIAGVIEFKKVDGSVLASHVDLKFETSTRNFQTLSEEGLVQNVDHFGHTKKTSSIGAIFDVQTFGYPLKIWLSTAQSGDNITYDIALQDGSEFSHVLNNILVLSHSSFQNGTSEFHVTPNGNYGYGETKTVFSYIEPADGVYYSRTVAAANGTVVLDE